MLPKIDPGILGSVKHEIDSSWVVDIFKRIEKHDPVMGQLMLTIGKRFGADALGQALLVYRLIESQVEANKLKELFE